LLFKLSVKLIEFLLALATLDRVDYFVDCIEYFGFAVLDLSVVRALETDTSTQMQLRTDQFPGPERVFSLVSVQVSSLGSEAVWFANGIIQKQIGNVQ
jgi:hypothetical protein